MSNQSWGNVGMAIGGLVGAFFAWVFPHPVPGLIVYSLASLVLAYTNRNKKD